MKKRKLQIVKEATATLTVCTVIATGCALSACVSGGISLVQFIARVAINATVGFYGHVTTTQLADRIAKLKSKNPAPKGHRVRL